MLGTCACCAARILVFGAALVGLLRLSVVCAVRGAAMRGDAK